MDYDSRTYGKGDCRLVTIDRKFYAAAVVADVDAFVEFAIEIVSRDVALDSYIVG